eukprot:8154536-Heterocapsa_arctica.AAC.1
MCLVIPTKSPELEYTLTTVFKILKRQGHTTVVLMTDGEHSIKLLSDKVAEKRLPLKTIVRHTPRYSSASLGAMGVMQKLMQGQIRTMKAELEA